MESEHLTLTANTVTTIDWPEKFQNIEVVNVNGVAAVYFTVDGSTPTVEGEDTILLPAAVSGVEVPNGRSWSINDGGAYTIVKLISAGTVKVSVRAW